MAYFRKRNHPDVLSANKQRNKFLKAITFIFFGASVSLLLARADLIINPQISNSIAFIRQFFVTSDGTSSWSVSVVLDTSGVFAKGYCNLSGSMCKTVEDFFNIDTQLSGINIQITALSGLYLTGGQVDAKILTASNQLIGYMTGNFLPLSGCANDTFIPKWSSSQNKWTCWPDQVWVTSLTNYYTKQETDTNVASAVSSATGSLTNYITTNYYNMGQIDIATGSLKNYVTTNYYTTGQITANYYTTGQINAKNYLTSEWDPVFLASYAHSIGQTELNDLGYIQTNMTNINNLISWWNHATQWYLTSASINALAQATLSCSSNQIPKYNWSTWVCGSIVETDPTILPAIKSIITWDINTWNAAVTNMHAHLNKSTLDGIAAQDVINWNNAVTNMHAHANKNTLDSISAQDLIDWDSAVTYKHSHANKSTLDGIAAQDVINWNTAYGWWNHATQWYLTQASWAANNVSSISSWNYAASKVYNGSTLDGIDWTRVGQWDTAYTNNHTHANKAVLDGIDSSLITQWNWASDFVTWANASNTLHIDNTNHRVGIGTGTPSYTLTVQWTWLFSNSVFAQAFLYNSDRRLKTNIVEIADPLEKINQLHGYTFDWKSDGRHDIGVIAQEVEAVFPQAVVTKDNGYKAVSYPSLVAPIIQAIKALYTKYLDQQNQIDDLKSQIDTLKTIVSQIK